jgi:hypothetical protein
VHVGNGKRPNAKGMYTSMLGQVNDEKREKMAEEKS